ncbi:hypothetical protein BDK51DRAFT_49084, partial [Blyttiomyces helicus]
MLASSLVSGLSFPPHVLTERSHRGVGILTLCPPTPSPEAELSEARREIKTLKDERRRLASEKRGLEEKIICLETDVNNKDVQLREATMRIEGLETDRRFLFERNKELSARCETLETQMMETKQNLEKATSQLRKENADIREKASTIERRLRERIAQKEQEFDDYVANQEDHAADLDRTKDEVYVRLALRFNFSFKHD